MIALLIDARRAIDADTYDASARAMQRCRDMRSA